MLWEVDIYPAEGQPDAMARDAATAAAEMHLAAELPISSARGYLIQGQLDRAAAERIAAKLLADRVVERTMVAPVGDAALTKLPPGMSHWIHVLPKPGVMDPVAQSAMTAIVDLGLKAEAVRTLKKFAVGGLNNAQLAQLCAKVLANDAIEQVVIGPLKLERLDVGAPYKFQLVTVPLGQMDDAALVRLSREGQLFLSLMEMKTIQAHFQSLGRDPTDVELETVAQTWSEHCSHKTLAGRIDYRDENGPRHFQNMLRETIFAATQNIRAELGKDDWCVSVFADNAGVIRFDDRYNVVFKVETHNHPSALEPYGGANTGIGGVIRDPMGTGMGAKPICNTDVFCFAPPETPPEILPPGVLHPRRVIKGVVAGVRDYGNRMGIPTVNGAVYFDPRYLGNPLVYCGNIGLLPREMSQKQPRAGDLIVALGGRTGRDGIHGATFSSAELTSHSETVSGGAVQIGNAITEKMLLDVLLVARDRGLYNAVTDCGAGGFSSAVGEMGEKIGAEVHLDRAPLKYEGLSYTEIWISEAQERMILAVPDEKWAELSALCESEGVEATVIGRFEPTGRLMLKYAGHVVADLAMEFLHDGRPPVVREAVYESAQPSPLSLRERARVRATYSQDENLLKLRHVTDELDHLRRYIDRLEGANAEQSDSPHPSPLPEGEGTSNFTASLLKILSAPNVCSKEWIIRQYDHEVQGGSAIKPLVGATNDGPGDAAVVRPVLDSRRGIVIACGMNPRYGDFDTYWMAASAIDEAVRNCVAVGADPARIAILDNFCWGTTDRPETLGSLVRAALACHDVAVALGTPFISGKDSLNNEFRPSGKEPISIPPSLLISALGQIDDVSRCVTMDLKSPGNLLYIVGQTRDELGGSHYAMVEGLSGGEVPRVDAALAKQTFAAVHQAISTGLLRACHDLSEGGLAAAAAEMAFAGKLGARIELSALPSPIRRGAGGEGMQNLPSPACGRGAGGEGMSPAMLLFSESNTRFLCEIEPAKAAAFEAVLANIPHAQIGEVVDNSKLEILHNGETLIAADLATLKEAWQKPLRW